jgi:hypothetical protein
MRDYYRIVYTIDGEERFFRSDALGLKISLSVALNSIMNDPRSKGKILEFKKVDLVAENKRTREILSL